MALHPINFDQWQVKPHDLWDNQSLLLSCGDFLNGEFNCMTVGWGSFGTMWSRPFAMVVVRPQRFTFQFMEKYSDFSLCAFSSEYQPALSLLGRKSGRNSNKIQESALTPTAADFIKSPTYKEASLSIECKKIYWDDLKPDHFLAKFINSKYPQQDYHRIYYGEIINICADSNYQA